MTAANRSPLEKDAAATHPMRGTRRHLFLAELLVGFGPCAVMAFASLATLGPATSQLLQKFAGTIEPINDVPWRYAIEPLFLSLGALAGLLALQEVARALLSGRPRLAYAPTAVILMAVSGVAAIVIVGLELIPHEPMHPVAILCVYFPLLATPHIILMSRRLLFPPSPF